MARLTRVTDWLIAYKSKLANTVEVLLQDLLDDVARLESYGGKADGKTDNLQAFNLAVLSGKRVIKLQAGQYVFSDGITLPAGISLIGTVSPELGFGTHDDKQFLREGYINKLPGTSFIFKGVGTQFASMPNRVDRFSRSTYCMRVANTAEGSLSSRVSGLAIIQDMRVFTPEGVLTKPYEDMRASYQVGLYIDDAARNVFTDVTAFGYFDHAGVVVCSKQGNDDPDYNTFNECRFTGRKAAAIISDTSSPASFGLSGTKFNNCGLYSLDHHSRAIMTDSERRDYYSDAGDWSCHYVDGDVDASTAEINGHYLYGCELRTRANTAIELDHASNVHYINCVIEQSPYGIPNSNTPKFKGSANVKKGVSFVGCRINYESQIFNEGFAGIIPVGISIVGDPLQGRTGVSYCKPDKGWSVAILGASGGVGDAALQLTSDVSSQNKGWKIAMDVSQGNLLDFRWDGANVLGLTTNGVIAPTAGVRKEILETGGVLKIADQTITVSRSYHPVSPQEGNDGTITTINGGVEGMRLILRPTSSSHNITLKRTGGNIRLADGQDKTLQGSLSSIELMFRSNLWVQISPVLKSS